MPIYRSDMGRISVSVDGVSIDNVSWDKFEGGDMAPDGQMYNPGGMAPAVAVGGMRKRSNITIQRAWSNVLYPHYIALDNASGIASVTCSFQPMLADRKTPGGDPTVYTGVLDAVTRPGYDSSSSSIVYLQIVVMANEAIS